MLTADEIDMEALLIFSHSDFRELKAPPGPRIKMQHGVADLRAAVGIPEPAKVS